MSLTAKTHQKPRSPGQNGGQKHLLVAGPDACAHEGCCDEVSAAVEAVSVAVSSSEGAEKAVAGQRELSGVTSSGEPCITP